LQNHPYRKAGTVGVKESSSYRSPRATADEFVGDPFVSSKMEAGFKGLAGKLDYFFDSNREVLGRKILAQPCPFGQERVDSVGQNDHRSVDYPISSHHPHPHGLLPFPEHLLRQGFGDQQSPSLLGLSGQPTVEPGTQDTEAIIRGAVERLVLKIQRERGLRGKKRDDPTGDVPFHGSFFPESRKETLQDRAVKDSSESIFGARVFPTLQQQNLEAGPGSHAGCCRAGRACSYHNDVELFGQDRLQI
jgi:hypothetical protein